MVLRRRG